MLGLGLLGYYPSSPKKPTYALHEDILELFHWMYMKGPCSKQNYCNALQRFVEKRKRFHSLRSAIFSANTYSEPSTSDIFMSDVVLENHSTEVNEDSQRQKFFDDHLKDLEVSHHSVNAMAHVKVPEDIYDNFRHIYSAWLEVQSILDVKAEQILKSPTTPGAVIQTSGSEVGSLSPQIEMDELSPIPLKDLCPVCFGNPESEYACICFDGNFQLKTLKSKAKTTNDINKQSQRDLRDKRLFVDNELPSSTITPENTRNNVFLI
jgi:hypothetical protein